MRSAAKAYLQRVRELDAAQRSSDDDDDDDGGGDRHAQLSERLRREALEVTFRRGMCNVLPSHPTNDQLLAHT